MNKTKYTRVIVKLTTVVEKANKWNFLSAIA